ncbi:hypothetical protein PPACK8108_LOCUS22607 [Phakopsora pachyrhizi]|uniref:Uncharacterized protein n=1 Tax=Phakopsora pachyrhizi TaxID=170000 RepID=A0AAV0BN38_PHAPC|nr:hypothetical protein PPACK8108_LOCUS22607 [Phakopsora pachyrhizi]
MVGPPDSNCTPFNSDFAINTAVTKSTNTLIPEVPLPVPVSCPSQFFLQHEDFLSATLGNIYHLKTLSWNITLGLILALVKNRNSRIEGNIHDVVYIMQTICNPPIVQQMIWANLFFESLHLVARDIIAPVKFVPQQVTTENPLSVEYALASAILPMEGFHVLIAINMVKAHAKFQDIPSGPSSSMHPKRKGKASSSSIETVSSKTLQLVCKEIGLERLLYCLLMAFCAAGVRGLRLGSNNWRKCGAPELLQIITLSNEILKLKGNDFEEPYWPRTSKYILQIIKSCFLPADPKSNKPMCPSRYEIAKCIVLDFGDTWHSKVDDSRKQHLSLPKKAPVNAVISELS